MTHATEFSDEERLVVKFMRPSTQCPQLGQGIDVLSIDGHPLRVALPAGVNKHLAVRPPARPPAREPPPPATTGTRLSGVRTQAPALGFIISC